MNSPATLLYPIADMLNVSLRFLEDNPPYEPTVQGSVKLAIDPEGTLLLEGHVEAGFVLPASREAAVLGVIDGDLGFFAYSNADLKSHVLVLLDMGPLDLHAVYEMEDHQRKPLDVLTNLAEGVVKAWCVTKSGKQWEELDVSTLIESGK